MHKTLRPWLTIVIPAYNASSFLAECIESIDPSSNEDVRVLVVDDGSTDNTEELARALASCYPNLSYMHKQNGGASSARNLGYTLARTDWVWFVDADDLIEPQALTTLRKLAIETDADMLHFRIVPFFDRQEPVWGTLPRMINADRLDSAHFKRNLYRGKCQHYLWTFLFRTSSLQSLTSPNTSGDIGTAHTLFPEEFSLYEDVISIQRLLEQDAKLDVLEVPLYGYRQVAGSITHSPNDSAADSGLRAVQALGESKVDPEILEDKLRMEIGLLFSAYKLVERRRRSDALRCRIAEQIRLCSSQLGFFRLRPKLAIRYILLRASALDLIISLRAWRQG